MPQEERLKLVVDLQPSDEEEDMDDIDGKWSVELGRFSKLTYHKIPKFSDT